MTLQHHKLVNFKQAQRGASLLEAIAFLGIAAVVILGAVSLLGGAFSSANINKTSTEIVTMRTNIAKLFIGQDKFSSADATNISASIQQANMAPATLTWDSTASAWKNAFQGNTKVISKIQQYYLEYTNVPTNTCIPLVMTAGGWAWVTVNTDAAIHTAEATAAASGVFSTTLNVSRTLDNVTKACSASDGKASVNTLRFYGTL